MFFITIQFIHIPMPQLVCDIFGTTNKIFTHKTT